MASICLAEVSAALPVASITDWRRANPMFSSSAAALALIMNVATWRSMSPKETYWAMVPARFLLSVFSDVLLLPCVESRAAELLFALSVDSLTESTCASSSFKALFASSASALIIISSISGMVAMVPPPYIVEKPDAHFLRPASFLVSATASSYSSSKALMSEMYSSVSSAGPRP